MDENSSRISTLHKGIAVILSKNRRERWMVHLIALLVLGMGIVNLISAVQPALRNRLEILELVIPLEIRFGSRLTSVLIGFAFLLIARSLWRRKRTAWLITTILLAVSIVSHLIKGLDFEEASISLVLLILLIIYRKSFHTESDRPSVKQGLFTLGVGLVFTLVYGTVGIYYLDHHFSISFNIWQAFNQIIVIFTTLKSPDLIPVTRFGHYFVYSIYFVGMSTLSLSLFMLIRPVILRKPASISEYRKATEIVQKYGHTSLARATLFDDKSYFFSNEGVVISYALAGRMAVVLGDPIGPAQFIAESILAFRDFCERNDWELAFASVLPDYLNAYKDAGFDTLCIGNEGIVILSEFSLEGSKNKGVRNIVSKMERLGYRTEVYLAPLDEKLVRSLKEISDAWLTSHSGGEMYFSDGRFEESYIRDSAVIVVHAANGKPVAFANFIPEYQKNELSIDLMRHFQEVESGTMNFLFAKMLLWAKAQGYDSFSLGLSALSGVGEKPEDPRIEQALHRITEIISRYFNFKGLHDFKDKFHPFWEPRYLIYKNPASLPEVLSALIQVHAGKNYLWKFLSKRK